MKHAIANIELFCTAHGIKLVSDSIDSLSTTVGERADVDTIAQAIVDIAPVHFLSFSYEAVSLDYLPLPCLVVGAAGQTIIIQRASEYWVNLSGDGFASNKRIKRSDFDTRFSPRQVIVYRGFSLESFHFSSYLVGFARGNWKRMMRGLSSSISANIASLIMPIGALLVVDKVIAHNGIGTLDVIVVLVLCAEIFRFAMTVTKNIILGEVADEFVHETESLLIHSQLNQLHQKGRLASHELNQLLRHIEFARKIFVNYSIELISDALFIASLIALMFLLSPLLAMIALVGIGVNISIAVIISYFRRSKAKQRLKLADQSNKKFVELLINGVDRRMMGREHNTIRDWNENSSAVARFLAQSDEYKFAIHPINTLLLNCLRVIVIWFGAIQAVNGFLTLGQFIAFNLVVALSLNPITKLSTFISDLTELKRSSKEIFKKFKEPLAQAQNTSVILPPVTNLGNLEFRGVNLLVPGADALLVSNIDFVISPGEKIALLGSSGAGKSTLFSAILGNTLCFSGEILLNGKNLCAFSLPAYRRRIGVLSQEGQLSEATILENLQLGEREFRLAEIEKALRSAQIYDRVMKLENGLDEVILSKSGTTLSQGEKQRLLLARALVHGSDMLLLDEPTSALDKETEEMIGKSLASQNDSRTCIVVTHSLALASKFDRIFIIFNKRLHEFTGDNVESFLASVGNSDNGVIDFHKAILSDSSGAAN